jgi:hypothetical protein
MEILLYLVTLLHIPHLTTLFNLNLTLTLTPFLLHRQQPLNPLLLPLVLLLLLKQLSFPSFQLFSIPYKIRNF